MRTRTLALLFLWALMGCKSPYQDPNRLKDKPPSAACVTARIHTGIAHELLDRCIGTARKDPTYKACGDSNDLVHFRECALNERCAKENEDYSVSQAKTDVVCSPEHRLIAGICSTCVISARAARSRFPTLALPTRASLI